MRRLTDEQRERAAALVRIAEIMADQHRRYAGNWHEFISAAHAAVLDAAVAWEPSRGASLETYAYLRLKTKLMRVRNKIVARDRLGIESLDDPESPEVPDGSDPVGHRLEIHEEAESILGALWGRERDVMALLYLDGLTTAEIAARTGMHPTTINGIHRRALAKLRQRAVCAA